MTATVYGELSADERRVIVIAATEDQGELIYLARRLKVLTPLVKRSDPPGALVLSASWPAVVQLAGSLGDHWRAGPHLQQWINTQAQRRQHPALESLTAVVPEGLTPRPYQVDGARMIAATGHALITDEPGTGKTITTILGLLEIHARHGNRNILRMVVISPASVVDSWVEHFHTWAPWWRTVAWRGPQRHSLAGTADVYVCSYDVARADAATKHAPLLRLEPHALVVDECHLIKNHQAKRTIAVRRLGRAAQYVIALSGTPITHHPADLWPTLTCLEPHAWPSRERWVHRYCLTIPGDYDEQILGLNPGTEGEFRVSLLGQHRRVAKVDVLAQLPPKVYSVRTVQMPPAYRNAYRQMERQMLAELPDGQEVSVMSVVAQLTVLSRMACAAADVETTVEVDEQGIENRHIHLTLKEPSWKVDALLEVLAERPDQQTLVFAPSKQLIELAGEAVERSGQRVGYIVGGQSAAERTATVDAFQKGRLDVVCATTGAGGVGLTLTAASCVVFLQRPWSLVESVQAEDRAHRIGSERHESIEIIDIVTADTIDTRVRSVLRERAGQLAQLVQDPRIVAELLGGTPERSAA